MLFFPPSWHRYVNHARHRDEANLLAVQYKGSILFHCCRTINTGDELLVWPSSKLHAHFSDPWAQTWYLKLNATGTLTLLVSIVHKSDRCKSDSHVKFSWLCYFKIWFIVCLFFCWCFHLFLLKCREYCIRYNSDLPVRPLSVVFHHQSLPPATHRILSHAAWKCWSSWWRK